jgi:hypothetical protein
MSHTESMVERVAKAMSGDLVPWDRVAPVLRDLLLQQARWAIEAMRVPTEKMMAAADEACDLCWSLEPGEGLDADPRLPIWDAMIDAALAPAPKGETDNG